MTRIIPRSHFHHNLPWSHLPSSYPERTAHFVPWSYCTRFSPWSQQTRILPCSQRTLFSLIQLNPFFYSIPTGTVLYPNPTGPVFLPWSHRPVFHPNPTDPFFILTPPDPFFYPECCDDFRSVFHHYAWHGQLVWWRVQVDRSGWWYRSYVDWVPQHRHGR